MAALIAVVEHRADIGGDARHPHRADRLAARLLHRVEGGAGGRGLRRIAAMQRVVMAGETQRQRIRLAAQDRRVFQVQLARRLGQPRLGAVIAGDERGPFGRENHVERRRAGHGAHRSGDGALERLLRRLFGRGAIGGGSIAHSRKEKPHAMRGADALPYLHAPRKSRPPTGVDWRAVGVTMETTSSRH